MARERERMMCLALLALLSCDIDLYCRRYVRWHTAAPRTECWVVADVTDLTLAQCSCSTLLQLTAQSWSLYKLNHIRVSFRLQKRVLENSVNITSEGSGFYPTFIHYNFSALYQYIGNVCMLIIKHNVEMSSVISFAMSSWSLQSGLKNVCLYVYYCRCV